MTDLQAVVDTLLASDRLLVVTHENPDGDALGSLVATRRSRCVTGQGRVDVSRSQRASSLRASTGSCSSTACWRELPADAGERVLVAVDCAKARPDRPRSRAGRTDEARRQYSTTITTHHVSAR